MRYKLLIIYSLLGFVLIQYQNCAPSSESLAEDTPGFVDGIDSVNPGTISFSQSKVAASLDKELVVYGVCEQSGSLISWKLEDSDGEAIERGLSECHLGSFEVSLSDDWQNFCDQELELWAALGADSQSQTIVETHCD